MGAHLIDGQFQSDKYPTTPRGKVPLSVNDPAAQDLLSIYAARHRAVDAEFSEDLDAALAIAGYDGTTREQRLVKALRGLALNGSVTVDGAGVQRIGGGSCELCETEWRDGETERHAATCLLHGTAPQAAPQDDYSGCGHDHGQPGGGNG